MRVIDAFLPTPQRNIFKKRRKHVFFNAMRIWTFHSIPFIRWARVWIYLVGNQSINRSIARISSCSTMPESCRSRTLCLKKKCTRPASFWSSSKNSTYIQTKYLPYVVVAIVVVVVRFKVFSKREQNNNNNKNKHYARLWYNLLLFLLLLFRTIAVSISNSSNNNTLHVDSNGWKNVGCHPNVCRIRFFLVSRL